MIHYRNPPSEESTISLNNCKGPNFSKIDSASDGIIMDPSKVEAITKWPRPTTVTEYHPGKANVVADALSRKSTMIACFDSIILRDLERLDVDYVYEVLVAIGRVKEG
ncbi:hypothetical protein Tco_1561864 [Tanacetum coccineum]